MSALLDRLREQAKQLSDDERCILGAELLAPNGDTDIADVEQAWDEEILRRVEEIKSGKVQTIPHEEVMASLRAEFGCRSK